MNYCIKIVYIFTCVCIYLQNHLVVHIKHLEQRTLPLFFTQSHGLEKYHNNSNIHIALYL